MSRPGGADPVPDGVEALLRHSVLTPGTPGARGAAWAAGRLKTAVAERRSAFAGSPAELTTRLTAELGGRAQPDPEPPVSLRLVLHDGRGDAVVLDISFPPPAGPEAVGEVVVRAYAKQFLLGRHPERPMAERAISIAARPVPVEPPANADGSPGPGGEYESQPVVVVPATAVVSSLPPRPGWVAADVVWEPADVEPTDLGSAFTAAAGHCDGEPVTLAVDELPPLVLTGGLVVCDPFQLRYAPQPLVAAVPAGEFAVFIVRATTPRGLVFVAAALVRFASAPVTRWVMTTVPGQDLDTLAPGHRFEFGVDAGTACFADAATVDAMVAAAGVADVASYRRRSGAAGQSAERRRQLDSVNAYFDRVDETLVRVADAWSPAGGATVAPATGPGTIAVFSSGGGDGGYSSWLGYGAGGELCAAAIDFDVLDAAG